MLVADGVLVDDDGLLPDADVASASVADYPIPIAAIPKQS